MQPVYITAIGSFLPGDPIGNDEVAAFLGPLNAKQERLRLSALEANGIKTRHYAIDRNGEPQHTNAEMAALACRDALARSELAADDVEYIAAAASQGDLLAPGFASMVHAELGTKATEIASFTSFCASGMMALKSAISAIRSGEKKNTLVCASEFASRFLRAGYLEGATATPDTEFLRWTLSDGAGALLLENRPNAKGQSIRIDFVDLVSYADSYDTCMYAGGLKGADGEIERPWSNYSTLDAAVRDGAFHLRQDFRLLKNIVPVGLQRYMELIDSGKINPHKIDWALYHFSSDHFRKELLDAAERAGTPINANKIFTNLYEKGNTGSASIYLMLEELFNGGVLSDTEKVLCMVPESGRFIVSYMLLSVAGEDRVVSLPTPEAEPDRPGFDLAPVDDLKSALVRKLTIEWLEFERQLQRVPLIDKLQRGRFTIGDYRMLLRNLRQQVVDGARWIARAASNITVEAFDLRSTFLTHAHDEHRDFKLLESDYVAAGGTRQEILAAEKNIGSEALSAWMFHKASRENPIDLLGAMFIIEGLGQRVAAQWGGAIQKQLALAPDQLRFLLYHGDNDATHMDRFWEVLDRLDLTPKLVDEIVKTAKVTARLYRLQLEELDNI